MPLHIEKVSHRYGSVEALDGIELDIADGETIVLIGPSGCGKSTLLGILGGLLQPSFRPRHPVGPAAGGIAQPLHLHLPGFRPAAVAQRGEQRRPGAGASRALRRRAQRTRGRGACPHRPRRIRGRLSQAALRRHAPARRHRPRAGGAAGRAVARRAIVGARRPDPRAPDGRPSGDLGAREKHARVRHARSRGGGASGRPRRRAVAPSRPHPRRHRASTCRWPNADGPNMPACCATSIAGCGH